MGVGVTSAPSSARNSDRVFFGGMALVILAIVFVGFMRTFYLSSYFGRPALSTLRVVHGTAFTSWVVLFAIQTSLIAAGRREVHRRLGYAGAVLAAAMVPLGLTLAIRTALEGHAPLGLQPLEFLIIPVFDMLVFAPLVAADIFSIIREINAAGTTILLVEQNVKQALKVSGYAYVLETGKIALSGPSKALRQEPRIKASYLGQ